MSTRVPPHTCRCGHENDAASAVQDPDAVPKPQDIALCLYCGCVTQYNDDLTQQELTDADIEALIAESPNLKEGLDMAQVIGWMWRAHLK